MSEVTIGPKVYRTGVLNARQQFHVTRRLAPMADELRTAALSVKEGGDIFDAISGPLSKLLAEMKEADADYILDRCLAVAQLKQGETLWSPVMNSAGQLMFSDMTMPEMIQIVAVTITENVGLFFAGGPAPK